MMTQHRTGPLVAGVWGTMGAMIRRGDATVGNPNRAQIYKFELFEFIILFKLAKQFSIEQFEPTVSQSTVSSPPSQMGRRMGGGQTPLISGSRFREPAKSARAKCSSNLWRPAPPPSANPPFLYGALISFVLLQTTRGTSGFGTQELITKEMIKEMSIKEVSALYTNGGDFGRHARDCKAQRAR